MAKNKIKVKLVRSGAGRLPAHRATLIGLGLRRLNQIVELEDTKCVRGMISRVNYLVEVENH